MSGDVKAFRSVNDFECEEDLRKALTTMHIRKLSFGEEELAFRRVMHPAQRAQQMGWRPKEWQIADTMNNNNNNNSDSLSDIGFNIDDTETAPDESMDWVIDNCDKNQTEAQTVEKELERLKDVHSFQLLDEKEQFESFDRITRLASRIFDCPGATIALIDLGRQWVVSTVGLADCRELDRKDAFCAHAILDKEDMFIVYDATKDFRFCCNPFVTGPASVRFYAGVPLISPEGHKVGVFSVFDTKPRLEELSLADKQNLRELGALSVQALVDHRREKLHLGHDANTVLSCTARDLLVPASTVDKLLTSLINDFTFMKKLTPQQEDLLDTATKSNYSMAQKCANILKSETNQTNAKDGNNSLLLDDEGAIDGDGSSQEKPTQILDFVTRLSKFLEPFPKEVPMVITIDPSTPDVVFMNESKVFWSAVNFLTNACAVTKKGSVRMTISVDHDQGTLMFECEDTGPDVPAEKYPTLFKPVKPELICYDDDECDDLELYKNKPDGGFAGTGSRQADYDLNLFSTAVRIHSIGGKYGFRRRQPEAAASLQVGSVFWFSIRLRIPEQSSESSPVTVANCGTELINGKHFVEPPLLRSSWHFAR